MHPVLEEICRAKEPPGRIDVFRRWQQELRTIIAPLVEAGEAVAEAVSEAEAERVDRRRRREVSA